MVLAKSLQLIKINLLAMLRLVQIKKPAFEQAGFLILFNF